MRYFYMLGLLTAAACTTSSVQTATNPAAAFDRYRTFSIAEPEGAPGGFQDSGRTAEVERRLRPLVTAALERKGYVPTASGGDIVISFGAGQRYTTVHETTSISAAWLPVDEDGERAEGALRIDAFEGASNTRVWHGASRVDIPLFRIDQPLLQRSVERLLASFPNSGVASGS